MEHINKNTPMLNVFLNEEDKNPKRYKLTQIGDSEIIDLPNQNTIKNSQSFYTADKYRGLKQYSINDQSLVNNFDIPFNNAVNRMIKTTDDKYLFIGCDESTVVV